MRFKKIEDFVSSHELESLSKTKEMFVDDIASSRCAMQSKEASVSGDVVGVCAFAMSIGHTARLYGKLADIELKNISNE